MSKARLLAIALICAGVTACASGQKDPLPGQVDADKFLFDRGTALLAKKNWLTAREYFRRIVDSYPQSTYRTEAKLGVGDSYLGEGSIGALIMGANEFREFLQFFPVDPRTDYAQYRLTYAISKQMLRADLDQTATHETLAEVQKFNQNFPKSQYRPEVDKIYRQARDRLSQSEFKVGRLYFKAGYMRGAVPRFVGILNDDPGYTKKDEVYYYLGESFRRAGARAEAVPVFERLIAEFPKSKYARDARKRMAEMAPKTPPAPPVKR
jgi:outer membrane protein assembly factor BamD